MGFVKNVIATTGTHRRHWTGATRTSENVPSETVRKVHEQRSEGRYGQCAEREKGHRVVCGATLQAPSALFGLFLC
jgi:hypothetical protein